MILKIIKSMPIKIFEFIVKKLKCIIDNSIIISKLQTIYHLKEYVLNLNFKKE